MNKKAVVSAIMAMSLVTGGLAFGQDYGNRNGRDERTQRGGHQDRRDNNDARRDEHGAGPHREFHKGDRLPPEYRNKQYVVDDWRGHRLSAPPRGYHWVQTGGDYVLVAITSGVILQIFLNN